MFGHFYNSSFRRYIVLMGDLFSHVKVARQRQDTGVTFVKVPITYASKEHFMNQLQAKIIAIQNTPDKAKIETILPRMNLHMVDVIYNPQFKTSQQNRISVSKPKDTQVISQYSPTPVKMMFELGIFTRHQDDMFQIVEQIMPYFQPHFSTTITELFGNDITFDRDINIVHQSNSIDEQIDGESTSRRRLEWTMIFEVHGWIYPPVKEVFGEIRTIYLDFFNNMKEPDISGSEFESVDTQLDPVDAEIQEWNGESVQTYSADIPIPVAPQPSKPR